MHLCSTCQRRTVNEGRAACAANAAPARLVESQGGSIDDTTINRCDSFVRIGDGARMLTDAGGPVGRRRG